MKNNGNSSSVFLIFGMLIGLAAALFSLLYKADESGMPNAAIAKVGERYIGQEDYARAVAAVVADSGQTLSAAQRRRVLERLIDEALLLEYGLQQGLARSDRRVRANLISAVIEAKSVEAETRLISEEEAHAFYAEHRDYFKRPQQLRVAVLLLQNSDEENALRAAWEDGASLAQLQQSYGAMKLSHLPDALLPLGKLQQLIGASLAEAAAAVPEGAVSELVTVNEKAYLIHVKQRVDVAPAFAEVTAAVEAEMRRRGAEAAVREALDRLRVELDVVIAEERL